MKMLNDIVVKVEEMFLKEGFTRMSDYFGDEVFENKLSAHEILWRHDHFYFSVKHENEMVNIYYSNGDFVRAFDLYTSFSDSLSTSKIEDIVYDVIHGMSPEQEEIIRKYIDIDEDAPSKYRYLAYKSYDDEDYTTVDSDELFETSLLKIKEFYKETKLAYGQCHPKCLDILVFLYEISYINGQNDEAYDYARQLTEDVGGYYGKDSVEYYQSVFYQCQIMMDMHMAAHANVILLDAFTNLSQAKETDSLETLRILKLIVKCYLEMRLFKEANQFAGIYALLCANKKDYRELVEESKLLYLHTLHYLDNTKPHEIQDAFDALDLKGCQWDPDLTWAMLDVCIDYEIDDDALEAAQSLYSYYKYNYGIQNIHTVKCVSYIAICVFNMHEVKDALELQRYVVESYRAILGEKNPYYIDSLYMIANMYYHDHKWGKAGAYIKDAYRLYCDIFTKNHPDSLKALMLMADISHDGYRYENELTQRKEALNIACELYGHNDSKTMEILPYIVQAYSSCQLHGDAISLAKDYLNIMTELYGDKHIETVQALIVLSMALSDAGQYEEALNIDFQNLKTSQYLPDEYEEAVYKIIRFIAQDLYHLDRKVEAFNILDQTLVELQKKYGDDCPYIGLLLPLYQSLIEEFDL